MIYNGFVCFTLPSAMCILCARLPSNMCISLVAGHAHVCLTSHLCRDLIARESQWVLETLAIV